LSIRTALYAVGYFTADINSPRYKISEIFQRLTLKTTTFFGGDIILNYCKLFKV
jgi:hypothetical protein